ncbi:hypothetical protein ACKF11_13500 [Methylobacillus sp. Pita2]|uniref:hypothetical protein n=1 Tax=Methylobacillus sp. Pita2 TaxID=3383245 RepID=UPI0038B4C1A1
MSILQQLSDKVAQYISKGPIDIVLAGGAAMFHHKMRNEIGDFDIYTDDMALFNAWTREKAPDLDVTTHHNFWGQVTIGDAMKSPIVHLDEIVRIRCLAPIDLFIMKADAARERDLEDLALMVPMLDPMDILERMAELKKFNAYGTWYLSTENLLAEIQLQYGIPITKEHIAATKAEPADQGVLMQAFGLEMQYKRKIGVV